MGPISGNNEGYNQALDGAMDPARARKEVYNQTLNQHELLDNKNKALKQGIVHETTSVGVEALTGMKIEDLKKNANLKNKVTIKKEFNEGRILRNEMQAEMKALSKNLSKLNTRLTSADEKTKIIEESLDKLALLKLAIDRCNKEVVEGSSYRQFRQNVAKSLGYSTTNDAKSLIYKFNNHLDTEQSETVLNKYNIYLKQYSTLLQNSQKQQQELEKKMKEDPDFKIAAEAQQRAEHIIKKMSNELKLRPKISPFAQFNPFQQQTANKDKLDVKDF
jgi:hypothetical protein